MRQERRCALCDARFTPVARNHRFCSDYCRNRHWRDRHPRVRYTLISAQDVLKALAKEAP